MSKLIDILPNLRWMYSTNYLQTVRQILKNNRQKTRSFHSTTVATTPTATTATTTDAATTTTTTATTATTTDAATTVAMAT